MGSKDFFKISNYLFIEASKDDDDLFYFVSFMVNI